MHYWTLRCFLLVSRGRNGFVPVPDNKIATQDIAERHGRAFRNKVNLNDATRSCL
jgi:hypothetical protein